MFGLRTRLSNGYLYSPTSLNHFERSLTLARAMICARLSRGISLRCTRQDLIDRRIILPHECRIAPQLISTIRQLEKHRRSTDLRALLRPAAHVLEAQPSVFGDSQHLREHLCAGKVREQRMAYEKLVAGA